MSLFGCSCIRKRSWVPALVLWVLCQGAVADELVVIWESPGKVAFNEIPDAVGYRVEWAASLEGPWQAFSGGPASGLDFIAASGGGAVTAAVPMFFRVTALTPDRGPLPMVAVPGGTFTMGDLHDGLLSSIPSHSVTLDAFWMAATPVTIGQWQVAYQWATANGYAIEPLIYGGATDHPVSSPTWYDAVKWCNARSQMEGLMPCYTAGGAIYKAQNRDDVACDWNADGYRLPTEAEWERAARGGTSTRFPWGDRISHSNAHYYAHCTGGAFTFPYDDGPCGRPPEYANLWPPVSPVHVYAPNAYGLYDVIGNVVEWIWDWYAPYTDSAKVNPRGPDEPPVLPLRVIRSGPFTPVTVAARWPLPPEASLIGNHGFRPVRRVDP
jgi:formylglycine-generating enzyme required for sulfatase activity